jgi:hypothetical protein
MARLKAKGLDKQVVLGITSDNWMPEVQPVSQMFSEILPGVCWHSGAHNRMGGPDGRQGDKMRWACREYMYVPNYLPDPRTERRLGWQNPVLAAISQRLWEPMQPPDLIRTMPERGLLMGDNGAGRMGLDYWRVLDRKSVANAPVPGQYPDSAVTKMRGLDISDREFPFYGRYPETTSGQRNPNYYTLAAPGKDGPVPTIMTALMRENVQECEARTFIEEALANKRISGELAARCQKVLDERADFCRLIHAVHGWAITQQPRVTVGGGYQKRAEDLYRAAAEVAKATAR